MADPNIDNKMKAQGEIDKKKRKRNKLLAAGGVGVAGALIYKNLKGRVDAHTETDTAKAVAGDVKKKAEDADIRGQVVDATGKKAMEEGASEETKAAYMKALQSESKSALRHNEAIAKKSIQSEMNGGRLHKFGPSGKHESAQLSEKIAKEQAEESEARMKDIAKALGMEQSESGEWVESKGATPDLEEAKRLSQEQRQALRDDDVLKNSDVFQGYKQAVTEGSPESFDKALAEGAKNTEKIKDAKKAEGEVKGGAEGKAKGEAEGKAEGKAKGGAEGEVEGKAEGKAEDEVKGGAKDGVEDEAKDTPATEDTAAAGGEAEAEVKGEVKGVAGDTPATEVAGAGGEAEADAAPAAAEKAEGATAEKVKKPPAATGGDTVAAEDAMFDGVTDGAEKAADTAAEDTGEGAARLAGEEEAEHVVEEEVGHLGAGL